MASQVVFIHGGETFDTYEEYLDYLRSSTYDPRAETKIRWKHVLAERLAPRTVFTPTMPSKYNAKYDEWKLWFEKVIPYLQGGVILVGHSLGGAFLAKYLSENTFPVSIAATFLVAAPYSDNPPDYTMASFAPPHALAKLEEQAGALFLYHSTDDPVVPYRDVEIYHQLLPSATLHQFTDRGHFMQPEFPEIIEEIKSL